MTSPCDTTAYTASVARARRVPVAYGGDRARLHRRASTRRPRRGTSSPTGGTARPSTAGPWRASSARGPSSRRTAPRRGARRRAARHVVAARRAAGPSVSRHRSSGLVTTAASGTAASRPARARTCARPVSSRATPSVQPASTPARSRWCGRGGRAARWSRRGTLRGAGQCTMDGVIVDCALYHHGVREAVARATLPTRSLTAPLPGRTASSGSACTTRRRPSWTRWPRSSSCTTLAIEDALKAHQRPKVEEYDDSLFVVLKTVRYDEATPADRARRRDALRRRLVRRHRPARAGTGARGRPQAARARAARCSTAARRLSSTPSPTRSSTTTATSPSRSRQDIEEVEQRVFSPERTNERGADLQPQARGHRVPPGGAAAGRADGQAGAPGTSRTSTSRCSRSSATSPTTPCGSPSRSRASTTCSPRSSTPTSRRSASSRTRTCAGSRPGWRSPPCPPLIAGIYGMNFEHMPELRWRFGYPAVLAADGAGLPRPVPRLQAQRLALTGGCAEPAWSRSSPVCARATCRHSGIAGPHLAGHHGLWGRRRTRRIESQGGKLMRAVPVRRASATAVVRRRRGRSRCSPPACRPPPTPSPSPSSTTARAPTRRQGAGAVAQTAAERRQEAGDPSGRRRGPRREDEGARRSRTPTRPPRSSPPPRRWPTRRPTSSSRPAGARDGPRRPGRSRGRPTRPRRPSSTPPMLAEQRATRELSAVEARIAGPRARPRAAGPRGLPDQRHAWASGRSCCPRTTPNQLADRLAFLQSVGERRQRHHRRPERGPRRPRQRPGHAHRGPAQCRRQARSAAAIALSP